MRVAAEDRDALERLCRYMARPAVAAGRVSVLPDGTVAYRVKSPRSAGATHRLMTPMEFMARWSTRVPPPRAPLVRYHGVIAPNSPWRVAVVPRPTVAARTCPGAAGGEGTRPETPPQAPPKTRRIEWARRRWRVWGVDVLACGCGGRLKVIAAITERAAIVRILTHLGRATEEPRLRRIRAGPGE